MARTRLYPPSVDPGFPELSPTPSGWSRSKFRNVVEAIERPIKLEPNSRYRLLTAKRSRGGITLRGELKGREILTKTQFEAHAGDFLISRRQIIHGACGVVPEALHRAVVSNEYSTLRTRTGLLMDFLRHLSHTAYFQRTCFHSSHGVDVEKMVFKLDQWLDWPVNIPPLGEQRKIAAILSSVDDAIEATQAVIDQLQVVKKAMMAELLTRGLPGRHTRFKKTEIGEVPEDWEVVSAGDLCEVITKGATPADQTRDVGDVPFLKVYNIDPRGIIDFTYQPTFIPRSVHHGELRRSRVFPGDVLMNIVGPPLGKVAVVPAEFPESNINQAIAVFRSRGVEPAYLATCLSAPSLFSWALSRAKRTSTQLNLTLELCREYPLPVPPDKERSQIVALFKCVEDRLRTEEDCIIDLRKSKFALQSALLTGEIRVTPDPEEPAP